MRFAWHLCAGSLLLSLAACVPTPDYYSIPPQHKPETIGGLSSTAEPRAPAPVGEMFDAADSDADKYIVKDIKGAEGGWRWTNAEPELRFQMPAGELKRKFRLELGINDRTFHDTGPVTIVILVNGNELDRITLRNFGDHTYEKAVPTTFLLPGAENRVLMRVLNPWQAPDPGVKLGFVLRSAGFLPQ